MKPLLLLALLPLAIVACSEPVAQAPAKRTPREVVGEFRSKTYVLDQDEHVTMFDIPGRYVPTRCWALINTRTNTSSMRCDDEGDSQLPEAGAHLDR